MFCVISQEQYSRKTLTLTAIFIASLTKKKKHLAVPFTSS